MASYQIEAVLLVLALIVAVVAAFALYAFTVVCRMSLELQEQVVVRGTTIVTRMKFGKCRHK